MAYPVPQVVPGPARRLTSSAQAGVARSRLTCTAPLGTGASCLAGRPRWRPLRLELVVGPPAARPAAALAPIAREVITCRLSCVRIFTARRQGKGAATPLCLCEVVARRRSCRRSPAGGTPPDSPCGEQASNAKLRHNGWGDVETGKYATPWALKLLPHVIGGRACRLSQAVVRLARLACCRSARRAPRRQRAVVGLARLLRRACRALRRHRAVVRLARLPRWRCARQRKSTSLTMSQNEARS